MQVHLMKSPATMKIRENYGTVLCFSTFSSAMILVRGVTTVLSVPDYLHATVTLHKQGREDKSAEAAGNFKACIPEVLG